MKTLLIPVCFAMLLPLALDVSAQPLLEVNLQFQRETSPDSGQYETLTRKEIWQPSETAIIVCDCWDAHHCLNAVRRLEQFAPVLNQVLMEARERGVTIIHAPSDCMDAYAEHPARKRAINAPAAAFIPHQIQAWCSQVPAEERSIYPIDQSDGGEDDDPAEHAQWRSKLEAMGRNPNLPWKTQIPTLQIDADTDFISDRGDEVWNILELNGVKNVILTGVHTNMCVLGRPFGLRQMARNGKNVVLMRDMTDTMYNPARWPFVSHFEGTRRVIAHIERFVCPTMTSDQFIGGEPFRFAGDDAKSAASPEPAPSESKQHWSTVALPHQAAHSQANAPGTWYRAVALIPEDWTQVKLHIHQPGSNKYSVWWNGHPVNLIKQSNRFAEREIPAQQIESGDWNLIVINTHGDSLSQAPELKSSQGQLVMKGRWQFRIGKEDFSSMPLPAKFGGSADTAFSPAEPLWTSRPLTRVGEFTTGIEGPACDARGNIFAVNYGRQGTIGRVRPDGVSEVFVTLPENSIGNGIRFDSSGNFYVADYPQHNILKVDTKTRNVTVFAHHDGMNQPNDLAIAPDGTLYASDPNWSQGTGQLWRISRDGDVMLLAQDMGTTNGIEVSPDGKTLYVNESKQRNIWAFDIVSDGITNKRLIRKFADHGFDGMRCDVDGNLYITRHGKGTVVKLTPEGQLVREIAVLGAKPSNLCFGGVDGCTVYVTEVEFRRLVSFRVDRPGRSWTGTAGQLGHTASP